MLALAGFVGPEDLAKDPSKNWRMACELRKRKGVKAWLQEQGDEQQYLPGLSERNERALEIISRLHESNRSAWLELDSLK